MVQEKVFHQGRALSLQGHTARDYSRTKDGMATRFILKHQNRVIVDHSSMTVDDQSSRYKGELHKNNNSLSPRLVVLPLLITVEQRYQRYKKSLR